jgi:conjugative relaxase-like TrwC/TraI family protein
MLSMSHVTAGQAANYYEKDDYYSQKLTAEAGLETSKSAAQWYGNGAEILGLKGDVDSQIFKDLLHGQDPNGNCLHARSINLEKHRAATDYTFSAPKSVSIAGLIQQDQRAIDAHDKAVKTALSILESRYAQARIMTSEGRQHIDTGNITAAIFRHETSREQDPQLHSHCVVINTTQLADGTWRSLSTEEITCNQKLLGEIYQNELAYRLRQVGYEIEPKVNGQFELKGYKPRSLDAFSTRTQQIEEYIQRWEQELEKTGGAPLNAKQKKQATLNTRKRKQIIPREVLMRGWEEALRVQSLALPTIPEGTRDLSEQSQEQAAIATHNAIQHAAEREAVFCRSRVERFALENHLGQQSFADLERAIVQHPELLRTDPSLDQYTTQTAVHRELDTIRLMQQGKEMVNAIATLDEVDELMERSPTLTDGQKEALELSARTSDRVIAWQGVAGSGKTYSLKLLVELAIDKGYIVRGFAPSAEAAALLGREAEVPSDTIASLLNSQPEPNLLLGKEIWVVDEAGLLSAADAHQLLQKATEQDARVILVGDVRQLSAVGAGNPFKSLQAGGVAIAHLEQSLRQKTEDLREAIALFQSGQIEQSLHHLDTVGNIQEIQSQDDRLNQLAQDYLGLSPPDRDKTLILAGTNQERLKLTMLIRQGLQAEGEMGRDAFQVQVLRSKDLTDVQKKYAHNYSKGDVLIPTKTYKRLGLEKNQQYRVLEIQPESNRLVLGVGGETLTINPAECGYKSVYGVSGLDVGVGDRLCWTKNDRSQGIRNRQTFAVSQIDPSGNAQTTYDDGKTAQVNLNGHQHIDYALVSTTYSSQGKTAHRVLAALDHTTNRESLYVAISRAKHHLALYTANQTELFRLAQTSRAKQNASDYIPLFQVVSSHAQTSQNQSQTHPSAHSHRAIGECLGSRASASLTAPFPTSQHPDRRASGVAAAVSRLSDSASHLGRNLVATTQSDHELQSPDLPNLASVVEAIRERVYTESIGQAVRAIDEVVKRLDRAIRGQHQLAAKGIRLLGVLEQALQHQSAILRRSPLLKPLLNLIPNQEKNHDYPSQPQRTNPAESQHRGDQRELESRGGTLGAATGETSSTQRHPEAATHEPVQHQPSPEPQPSQNGNPQPEIDPAIPAKRPHPITERLQRLQAKFSQLEQTDQRTARSHFLDPTRNEPHGGVEPTVLHPGELETGDTGGRLRHGDHFSRTDLEPRAENRQHLDNHRSDEQNRQHDGTANPTPGGAINDFDYWHLWDKYNRDLQPEDLDKLESVLALKMLEDGQREEDVVDVLLICSPKINAQIEEKGAKKVKAIVNSKVNYTKEIAIARQEIQQAPEAERDRYRNLYEQNEFLYKGIPIRDADVHLTKKEFNGDRSNFKDVVKLACHSPGMQRLASKPDLAREYLIGVLADASRQHQSEQRYEMEREQKRQQQKQRGFGLEL